MRLQPVPCGNPKVIETLQHNGRSISKDWLSAIKWDGKSYCGWCNKNELPAGKRKYCSDPCAGWSTAFCNPQTSELAFQYYMQRQEFKCAMCQYDYRPEIDIARKSNLAWQRKNVLWKIGYLKEIPEQIKIQREMIGTYDPETDINWFEETPKGTICHSRNGNPIKNIKDLRRYEKKLRDEIQEAYDSYKVTKATTEGYWTWNTRDIINQHHRKLEDGKWTEVDHIIPVAAGGTTLGFENFQVLCHTCHKGKTIKDRVEIREFKRLNK